MLNPVVYITPGSLLSNHIYSILERPILKAGQPKDVDSDDVKAFFEILAYIKPYSGIIYRNGRAMKRKTFYDEKEWRYVPHAGDKPGTYYRLDLSIYSDLDKRENANVALAKNYQLYFEPKDIEYILISKENEILPLVKEIQNTKGKKYSFEDITLLTTKIISVEKVLRDF